MGLSIKDFPLHTENLWTTPMCVQSGEEEMLDGQVSPIRLAHVMSTHSTVQTSLLFLKQRSKAKGP